jgi:hypothetical protein
LWVGWTRRCFILSFRITASATAPAQVAIRHFACEDDWTLGMEEK